MPDVFFASQAYQRNDYGLPPEILVNMYADRGAAAGSGEPYALIPREGRVQFADTGEARCQGGFQKDGVAGGKLITVHDTHVYTTDRFGVTTQIGAIDLPIGPVQFASDRLAVVMLAPSGNVFRTDGTIVAQIIDVDLPTPVSSIAGMDQRILYSVKGDDQFYWSEVLDPTNILGLSFATAEREADEIVGLKRSHQELWIMGTETCEAYQGTGGPTEDAFQPIAGAVMERGALARDAMINADNSLFFLGDNGVYYRIGAGFVPQPVATPAITERVSAEIEKDNAPLIRAWTYARGGHEHIGLRLPTEGTFVYDVSTGRWWEARTHEEPTYQKIFAVRAFDRVLVGDENTGVISALDPKTYDDNGTIIERVATANTPVAASTPAFNFRIHVVEGKGSQTGQGSDPKVMLDFSDDGEGQEWSTERRLSIGKVGKYAKKVIARMLGKMEPPGRIWRVRITDPVAFTLRKGTINEIDP